MKWILQKAGADLQHLVAVTVFLVDFQDFAGFNSVYNQYFDADNGPTRTTVAVKRLPHPNLLIEIQGVAIDPSHGT
jgi:2-aminomuconate deaminase